MQRWCWLGLVMLTACGFRSPNGSGGGEDAAPSDGSSETDAPTDTSSPLCFGSFVGVCLVSSPGPSILVNVGATRTIDTRVGSADCVPTMSDVGACVVAATSITVNGTIRGTGPRPLVLLATGSIVVSSGGVIDVASHRGESDLGAGANPQPRCVSGTTPTARTGGWGGSNAGRGGDGDHAGINSTGGVAASALLRPAALFGGCAGFRGAGSSAGSGGAGGGAVDLIAAAIIIDGTVNASGAGADGASDNGAGGGGAGSGGLIVLDAPDVTINGAAEVFAQGGSGGEGGPSGSGEGGDGMDPTTPGQAAPGGSGGGSGGDGGAGATTGDGGDGGADSGGTFDDGGGGGGGGAGFIITTDPTPPSVPTSKVCPAFS